MNEVYADASFWIARLNQDDAWHERAREIQRAHERIVTSEAELIEVVDALCRHQYRALAGRFWRTVHDNEGVIVVDLDDQIVDQASVWFESRADRGWSIANCISYAIREGRGITNALPEDP